MPLRHIAFVLVSVACLAACASSRPAPGRATVEGTLRTLPRAGVDAHSSGVGYGDRRMRDVELVDYDRPGFAVVHLDEGASDSGAPDTPLRVTLRDGSVGARFAPDQAAVAVGATLEIHNASRTAHIVSVPSRGLVREIEPRAVVTIALDAPGPHRLFLLDVSGAEGLVFAAPGPFTVVSSSGAFRLRDLAPGPARLRAWHPRLPPTEKTVRLEPDQVTRVDLVLGVGHSDSPERAAHAEVDRP